jgi:hypothetical protein
VEFSVRCPSPPNTYSYVQEENSGSTRKLVEIYLLFMCISNLGNSCNTHAEREWARGTFLDTMTAEKSSSSPCAAGVIYQFALRLKAIRDTPAARGLEELFSAVLKGSLSPFMICMCIARIRLEIHANNK